jgi:hypothetical protein
MRVTIIGGISYRRDGHRSAGSHGTLGPIHKVPWVPYTRYLGSHTQGTLAWLYNIDIFSKFSSIYFKQMNRNRDVDEYLPSKRICVESTIQCFEEDTILDDMSSGDEDGDTRIIPENQVPDTNVRTLCPYSMMEITPNDGFYLTCGHQYHKNVLKCMSVDVNGVLFLDAAVIPDREPYFQCSVSGCSDGRRALAFVAEPPAIQTIGTLFDIDDIDAFTKKRLPKMTLIQVHAMMDGVKGVATRPPVKEVLNQSIRGPNRCKTCKKPIAGNHYYKLIKRPDGSDRRVRTCY